MCWNVFRLKRRSALLATGVAWDQRPLGRVRDKRPGCDVPLVLATTSIATRGSSLLLRGDSSRPQEGKTNLSRDGLNPAHVLWQWVNNPTLGDGCNSMIERADIEGSKSDVAKDAWPPQASYPCGNFSDTSCYKLSKGQKDR